MRKELVLLSLNLVVSGAIIIGLLFISFPSMTAGGPKPFTNGDFEMKMIFAVGLPIWLMVKVDALIRKKTQHLKAGIRGR